MKRKRILVTILIILGSLFTGLSSLLINIVTSQNIPHLSLPVVWLLLGIVTLAGIIVAILLHHIQTGANHKEITPEIRNRLRMLAKVRSFWISSVLEESLHGAALIVLGLREQRDAVVSPWRLLLQQQNLPTTSIPFGTHIAQVYDNVNGELLILGEPGAGKTTLLLELTRDLLQRAQEDDTHPIPVVFTLSSWAVKRQSLDKWFVEELNTKYQVPRKVGQPWVDNDQLLLLLDGLDEVSLDYREACIDAINAYRREHGLVPIVVCSRSTEYLTQTKRLQLYSAVIVQSLTQEQIEDYLISAGEKLTAVREAFHQDKVIQEIATTPLMLSVITLAYHGMSLENILVKDSLTTQRQQVFATYVQRMLTRRQIGPYYTEQQSIHWLAWIARQLVKHSETEFYLERMQLDWLPKNLFYRLLPSVVVGLIYGLGVGVVYTLYFALISKPNLLLGLACGSLIGLLNWFMFVLLNGVVFEMFGSSDANKKSEEVTIRRWQSKRQKLITFLGNRFIYGLCFGLLNGVLVGWLGALNNIFFESLPDRVVYEGTLSSGIIYGLVNLILNTLNFGLFGKLDKKIQPAEILSWSWQSLRRNMLKTFVSGLLIGLVYGTLMGLLYRAWALQISIGLGIGLGMGFIFSFISGFSHEMLSQRNIITPNQGIQNSFRNSVITGSATGLICGIGLGLPQSLGSGSHVGLVLGLVFGLSVGLNFWVRSGGTACILHVLLRACLWQANYAPWNYPRFLDFAVEHILLRKVGGGYIFIHRLLLDYFAELDKGVTSYI